MPYHGAPPLCHCKACGWSTHRRIKLLVMDEYHEVFCCTTECEEQLIEAIEIAELELTQERTAHAEM